MRSEIESGRERRKGVALMFVCVSLDNKLQGFSSVKSVLPVKVIGKQYLCHYLYPQALSSCFLALFCEQTARWAFGCLLGFLQNFMLVVGQEVHTGLPSNDKKL